MPGPAYSKASLDEVFGLGIENVLEAKEIFWCRFAQSLVRPRESFEFDPVFFRLPDPD